MSRDLHCDHFRDAAANHVADSRAPQIMEQQLRTTGGRGEFLPALAEIEDRLIVLPGEDVICCLLAEHASLQERVYVTREFHESPFAALRLPSIQANRAVKQVDLLHSQIQQFAFPEAESVGGREQRAQPKLGRMLR